MARSRKKHPGLTGRSSYTKELKKIANRKVRRELRSNHDLVLNGRDYRKMFDSFWIMDRYEYGPSTFASYCREAKNYRRYRHEIPSDKELWEEWQRDYWRK